MAVGVIGAGSFGTTTARLLSINSNVIIYTRSADKAADLNDRKRGGRNGLNEKIYITSDVEEICEKCTVLFPVVPSVVFADSIKQFSTFLRPSHVLIHGTKGLDLKNIPAEDQLTHSISRADVRTMSEVILQETMVARVGCLAGPNLAAEINAGLPTATVVASPYDEVIEWGQKLLGSSRFFVFGSHDLIGAELAGAFKNIIAIGSGMLEGMELGRNLQAMTIVRTLREIIHLGKALGSTSRAFLGTAGIGDIIATSLSEKSRNFQVGIKLAKGLELNEILSEMEEVAEGIRTLKIAHFLAHYYDVRTPIIHELYHIVYHGGNIQKSIDSLMRYPFTPDVDFL